MGMACTTRAALQLLASTHSLTAAGRLCLAAELRWWIRLLGVRGAARDTYYFGVHTFCLYLTVHVRVCNGSTVLCTAVAEQYTKALSFSSLPVPIRATRAQLGPGAV